MQPWCTSKKKSAPLVSLEKSAQIKNLLKKLKWRSQEAWLAPDGEEEFDENP